MGLSIRAYARHRQVSHVADYGDLIAASASLAAWVKFWMDMGSTIANAKAAVELAALNAAKLDLLRTNFGEYKERATLRFATSEALMRQRIAFTLR
jgi:hypothetical protein